MENEVRIPSEGGAAETAEVVDIQFRPGQKVYFFSPGSPAPSSGGR